MRVANQIAGRRLKESDLLASIGRSQERWLLGKAPVAQYEDWNLHPQNPGEAGHSSDHSFVILAFLHQDGKQENPLSSRASQAGACCGELDALSRTRCKLRTTT